MKIHPEMESQAEMAVARGWLEPELRGQKMDVDLATVIARPVARIMSGWYETAAEHCRNEFYYRGLVEEIGKALGGEAFTDDEGGVHDSVLCAKVPELVRRRLKLVTD